MGYTGRASDHVSGSQNNRARVSRHSAQPGRDRHQPGLHGRAGALAFNGQQYDGNIVRLKRPFRFAEGPHRLLDETHQSSDEGKFKFRHWALKPSGRWVSLSGQLHVG